jgi:N-acetylglucosamine kinase-like BadF-type ATPase
VLAHFGVTDAGMLVFEVYYHDPRRRLIAGLGPAVQASVDEGDAVAREIVADAAGELALAARSVAGSWRCAARSFRSCSLAARFGW